MGSSNQNQLHQQRQEDSDSMDNLSIAQVLQNLQVCQQQQQAYQQQIFELHQSQHNLQTVMLQQLLSSTSRPILYPEPLSCGADPAGYDGTTANATTNARKQRKYLGAISLRVADPPDLAKSKTTPHFPASLIGISNKLE